MSEIRSSSYVGTGVDGQTRPHGCTTGAPNFFWVKRADTGASCIWLSNPGGDKTWIFDVTDPQPDIIQGMDATNVTLGGNFKSNTLDATHHFLAIVADGIDAAIISWSGTGTDGRNINTGISGFALAMVFTEGGAGELPHFRTNVHSGDAAQTLAGSASVANYIQDMTGATLQVGTALNTSGETYYALIAKNIPTILKVFTYTGDGADDRDLSGTIAFGATPKFMYTNPTNGLNAWARFADHVGDSSVNVMSTPAANGIQSFNLGGAVIGSDDNVNASTVAHWGFVAGTGVTPASGGRGKGGSNKPGPEKGGKQQRQFVDDKLRPHGWVW